MNFANNTAFDALQYEILDQFEQAFHVVVCKVGYALGPAGLRASDNSPGWATLTPLPQAAPLISEDEYFGEMLRSGVRMESDLAPFKPRCDVIVNACAYAPLGRAVSQCQVRLIVQRPSTPAPLPEPPRGLNQHMAASEQALKAWRAEMAIAQRTRIPGERLIDKTLVVFGERSLRREGNDWRLSPAQEFSQMPIRYEMAFGGECRVNAGDPAAARVPAQARLSREQLAQHPDMAAPAELQPVAHSACEYNLLGRGYSQAWYWQASQCQELAAPRIEYPAQAFTAKLFSQIATNQFGTMPAVAGLGCVGRAWRPRRELIGNFQAKAHYAEDEYPELPQDFDFGYWNCAPRDQQCAHLLGDEEFALINLCAPNAPSASINQQQDTQLRFQLPHHVFYLALGDAEGRFGVKPLLIDTVTIEPEENRVEVVWRALVSSAAQLTDAQLRFAQTPEELAQLETMLAMQHSFAAEASEVPNGA